MATPLDPELLRRMLDAQANPVEPFDPTKITSAYTAGTNLAETIQTRKQAQEDRVKKLAAEIEKAKVQKQFVSAAQQPLTQPKKFGDVSVPRETIPMTLEGTGSPIPAAVGKKTAELGLVGDINKLQAQRRAEEAQRVSALNRPIEARNQAIAMLPEEAGKNILKPLDARGKISGRDIQQFYLVSPDGRDRIPVSYDEVEREMINIVTNEPIDRSKYSNYQMVRQNPQIRTDASGNLMVVDPTLGVESGRISTATSPIRPESVGRLTDIQSLPTEDRKEVLRIVREGRQDKNAKEAKQLLAANKNLIEAIKTDNKVLIDRLGGQIQKLISGDSGNLAQWEQRDPGARKYTSRVLQYLKMSAQGQLLDANKKELLELLALTEENYKENIGEYADQYAESIVELYPQLDKEAMKKKLGYDTFTKTTPKNTGNPGQNPQAQKALLWAQQNPNDPRAAQILQKLGVKR